MNLTKKPAEYTLTLTHEELLQLEEMAYMVVAAHPHHVRFGTPETRALLEFAKGIEQAGIKARGGAA